MEYDKFYHSGYQIFSNILKPTEVSRLKLKLENVYQIQVEEFGLENMKLIGEENVSRSPFLYDLDFIDLFYSDFSRKVVKDILGDHAILSLQNGIMVRSNRGHHQSFYHRDIIHQNFTSSTPLGINLYYCLDDYDELSGGTVFIPESHRLPHMPSRHIEESPVASAGSVILFDSMVYHKAGKNSSKKDRFGINNMFTLPFLKQQIKYSSVFPVTADPKLNRLLGFESVEHECVVKFREYRLKRMASG